MKYICDLERIRGAKCVEVDQQHYYLVRKNDQVRMFSLVCPHMGGIVQPQGDLLVCPIHKWKFDPETGESVVGSKGLREIAVTVADGRVMADIADPEESSETTLQAARMDVPPEIDIRLLAHACLEIKHNGFTLITDPWLDGPAFHGSWIQYPAPACGPRDIPGRPADYA